MDLKNLMALVDAECNDAARRAGVMTLGALRSGLAVLPPGLPVVIDDGSSPGEIASYRGYYDRLAIAPSNIGATVAEVIGALDAADGEVFHGYKGGAYHMDAHTFLHVASWGDCGRQVVGMHVEADRAVIETAEEQW